MNKTLDGKYQKVSVGGGGHIFTIGKEDLDEAMSGDN